VDNTELGGMLVNPIAASPDAPRHLSGADQLGLRRAHELALLEQLDDRDGDALDVVRLEAHRGLALRCRSRSARIMSTTFARRPHFTQVGSDQSVSKSPRSMQRQGCEICVPARRRHSLSRSATRRSDAACVHAVVQ